MSTLFKITVPSVLLIASATCLQPSYGGSASVGETTPAPAAAPAMPSRVVRPATGVSGAASTATIRPAAQQAFARLPDALATGAKAAPVLVIPAQEMQPEMHDRIVEDLSIMSRILEKSLPAEPEGRYSSLVTASLYVKGDIFYLPFGDTGPQILGSASGRPKALYIGGYGAMFSLRVTFPLVSPPEASKKATEPTDQVWAAAQRELAEPQSATRPRRAGPAGEPYKAKAVEDLKNTLTSALKHVSNIRDLEPESWLTLLVQGPTAAPEPPQDSPNKQALSLPTYAAGGTLLTLRAKKADIDQFAKGQLDETQFRQRVQIVTH